MSTNCKAETYCEAMALPAHRNDSSCDQSEIFELGSFITKGYGPKSAVDIDMFAGENQERKVTFRSIAPAYDSDGNIKRQQGVYYDDLGFVWKGEESEDDYS